MYGRRRLRIAPKHKIVRNTMDNDGNDAQELSCGHVLPGILDVDFRECWACESVIREVVRRGHSFRVN